MINKNDNAIEFINKCTDVKSCAKAMSWLNNNYKKDNNITTYDIVKKYLEDDNADRGWAVWALEKIGEGLDTNIRKLCINKILDPMIAFQLYIRSKFFTKEEENLLKKKFEGKLPTAEKELKDGVIVKCQ